MDRVGSSDSHVDDRSCLRIDDHHHYRSGGLDHHQRRGAPTTLKGGLAVGVVLPTKDEPRWIQDQTRFQNAFTAAGVNVQILFSQGDSAVEKKNVESLISQGVKSDHPLPAGRHCRGGRCR